MSGQEEKEEEVAEGASQLKFSTHNHGLQNPRWLAVCWSSMLSLPDDGVVREIVIYKDSWGACRFYTCIDHYNNYTKLCSPHYYM